MQRVLVTRPEPAASATAVTLREMGFEPIVLPLSRIEPLPVRADTAIGKYILVAASSANAIRHADAPVLQALSSLPFFAVGDRTAETARTAGFSDVHSAAGDVGDLAALVLATAAAGDHIAYLCGCVRRPDFETIMADAGIAVSPIETYDTLDMVIAEPSLAFAPVDFALLYSVKAAEALRHWINHPTLQHAVFCCMSARIADALRVESGRIRVASSPEQDALLRVLDPGPAA